MILISCYFIKDCVEFLKLEYNLQFAIIISYFIVEANVFDDNAND